MKKIDNTPIEDFSVDWGDPDGTGTKAKSLEQVQAFIKNKFLGLGYTYISTATPSTTPIELTTEDKVFYIAVKEGDYPNFGQKGITELTIFKSEEGRWVAESLNVPTNAIRNVIPRFAGIIYDDTVTDGSPSDETDGEVFFNTFSNTFIISVRGLGSFTNWSKIADYMTGYGGTPLANKIFEYLSRYTSGPNNKKQYIFDGTGLVPLSSGEKKQDKLVSGTNIKTINGKSILGSGDITIEGSIKIAQDTGNSTTAVMSQNAVSELAERIYGRIEPKYEKPSTGIPKADLASAVQTSLGKAETALQEHQDLSGKQDKVVIMTSTAGGMQPDRRYRVMLSSDIDITLIAPSDVYAHSYEIDIEVTEAHSVSFPSYVEWVKDLTIEAGKRYLITIDYNGSDYIAMYTTTEIGG